MPIVSIARRGDTHTGRVRRGAVALVLAAGLAVGTAGCSFVTTAQSQRPVLTTDGNDSDTDGLKVRGLLIVSSEDGKGALLGTVVNRSGADDRLVSLRVGTTNESPGVSLPDDEATRIGNDGLGAGNGTDPKMIAVSDPSVAPGKTTTVQLTFENAPAITLDVMIVKRQFQYADVPVPGLTGGTPQTT